MLGLDDVRGEGRMAGLLEIRGGIIPGGGKGKYRGKSDLKT